MFSRYDRFITEGYWHKCPRCGERYSDSDRGCGNCYPCGQCEELEHVDDLDEDYICPACVEENEACDYCGENKGSITWKDMLLCPVCYFEELRDN